MKEKPKETKKSDANGAELLYRISKAIASVKDGRELLKIIVAETQKIFGFYDIGLLVRERNGDFYTDWATFYAEISPSAANFENQAAQNYQFSPDEPLLQYGLTRAAEDGKPFISEMTAEFAAEFVNFSQLRVELAHGYKQFLVTTLKFGGEVFGLLTFNSTRENHFDDKDFELFQSIADLVAIAVANIQANEEIAEREREKALLLAVSEDIAAVRDKRDLLQTIIGKVKPLFGFYDCGVMIVDKDRRRFYDWAVLMPEIDASPVNEVLAQNNFYRDGGIDYEKSLLQNVIAELEQSGQPIFWDYQKDHEDFSDTKLLAELKNLGYKQGVATLLRAGGEIIGAFFINSLESDVFRREQFGLLQGVADQIAVAVSNILANEEIAEREREKSVLLQISQVIATVRSKQDLLQLIIEKIKPILNFYDCGIFVFDREKMTLEDLTVSLPRISPSAANARLTQIQAAIFEFQDSVWEQVFEKMRAAGEPVIVSYKNNDLSSWSDYVQSSVIEQTGYEDCLTTILNIGGEEIGAFAVNSLDSGAFSENQFGFFQNIANQIAVAVSNILANEEILEREREKDILLSISQAIATIQNHEQLLKVIFERIQPIFNFYDVGLFILSEDGKRLTDWAANENISPSDGNRQVKEFEMQTISVEDSPLQRVINQLSESNSPVIKPYDLNYLNEITDPLFRERLTRIIGDVGYREFMATNLKIGGKIIGLLFFNSKQSGFFKPAQLAIFQSVAEQIAVAVANILANKEILERTREKSRLLEITELIAQVKANDDLLRLIVDKIKPLFGFEDCGLFVLSADKKTHKDLAAVIPGVSPSEFNERIAALPANIPHSGSVIEEIMWKIEAAGKPVLLDFVDLVERFPDYPQFDGTGVLELGYRDCLAANLVVRGEPIGMFCINALEKDFFQPQIFPLFQAVAHSISIAVANILANDEILERTREKSVLLSISEDIAGARNAVELLQVIRDKSQQLIPFYDTGILIVEPDGEHHYDLAVNLRGWDNSDSNRKLHDLGLHRMVHPNSYVEYVMRLIEAANSPVIEDYQQRTHEFDYPFFTTLQEFGYQEGIGAALKSGGKTFGTLWLNSLEKNHFKPEQFEIFQALADQVAVAVSNILANDEIKNQLAEITDLKKRLEAENIYLTEEIKRNYNFGEIIGASPALNRVFEIIETVAPTSATVLIQGETGTGKELIARAIHNRSTRSERPLIKINCATLPRELIESELFGHERGSFTGATEKRIGKFELADKGTIFLDEIGELPLEMQVKLLRVLQEREIERLGGKGAINLDLRVVAATNRNLAQEVQAGRFRADLYYRLCTVEVFMPPLRERREDIEPLTMYFARKYAAKFSRRIERVSSKMLAELNAYNFPGNIRELEHIVEHAVIFSKNEKLILPRPLMLNGENKTEFNNKLSDQDEPQTLEFIEREHIENVLRQTAGRIKGIRGAAEILGLNPATVYFRMKKLGIEKLKN